MRQLRQFTDFVDEALFNNEKFLHEQLSWPINNNSFWSKRDEKLSLLQHALNNVLRLADSQSQNRKQSNIRLPTGRSSDSSNTVEIVWMLSAMDT